MRLANKEINDECAFCGNVLDCELCLDGHGVKRERNRVVEMIKCQFAHEEKRKQEDAR